MALKLKVKEVENTSERLICIGLIASDEVIKQLAPLVQINFFTAKYTRIIAEWCLDYYARFGRAPKKHIKAIFEHAKRNLLDSDVADIIEALLTGLSNEVVLSESNNEQFILAKAEEYLQIQSINMLCEDVLALTSTGRITEAEAAIVTFKTPKRPQVIGIDVLSDDFWNVTDADNEILFRFPGELDKLIGPVERESFISLIAPEKRGKTWFLLWISLVALRQRCNVAFFSAGDMTRRQLQRRIGHMLTGKDPKRSRSINKVPVLDCLHNQTGECPLGKDGDSILLKGRGKSRKAGGLEEFPNHVVCTDCFKDKNNENYFIGRSWMEERELPQVNINDALGKLKKHSGNKQFKLFTYPLYTLTIAEMEAVLDIEMQNTGFVPDVIIIDYADVLAPEVSAKKLDYRNQINDTWMRLRAVSQIRNCSVITATQAKLEARKKSQVDQWDTSEDKRKLAHVTAMIALNQTPEEKRQGLMRVSNLATRDDAFDVDYNVGVLQCLAIGKPYLLSFPYKVDSKTKQKGGDLDD